MSEEATKTFDEKISKMGDDIAGLTLKEAKAIVDDAPKAVKEKASKEEAEELKTKLEEAGGTVNLK